MKHVSRAAPILAILGSGLLLRLVLAYVAFPNQGYTSDLGLFSQWAQALASSGPGSIYRTTGANYPPGYLLALWALGIVAAPVSAILGTSQTQAIALLLKLPAILADVGIAALVYAAGRRWFGERAGLLGAALYLFVPVTWLDSAMWGQVDAVGALVALAAIVALAEGWSEVAAVLAVLAVLVKFQDAVVLAVVVPVLLRRHLFVERDPTRLGTSALSAAVAGIAVLLPFDIWSSAPASLATVPVIGHVAGLISLFGSLRDQYSVLTANAFNGWSLVGPDSLASSIGGTGASWTSDSLALFGGVSASLVGTMLLFGVTGIVAIGLLRRDDRLAIVLGLCVLMLAFYALPTRVHERYLVPFFAPAALLAGAGIVRALGYVGVALANSVNVAAILSGTFSIGFGGLAGRGGTGGAGGGLGGIGAGLGGNAASRFGGGGAGGFGGSGFSAIDLPFAALLRSENVVALVALGQTLALVALVAIWLVLVLRPSRVALRGVVPGPVQPAVS